MIELGSESLVPGSQRRRADLLAGAGIATYLLSSSARAAPGTPGVGFSPARDHALALAEAGGFILGCAGLFQRFRPSGWQGKALIAAGAIGGAFLWEKHLRDKHDLA